MNIKRWLNEDKGRFGAFLILLIMGLFLYALQQKHSVSFSEPVQNKTVTPTSLVTARKPLFEAKPSYSEPAGKTKPGDSNSALIGLSSVDEADNFEIKKAGSSTSTKAKPKSTKRNLSKADIVRSKLKAGMSVNQIAKATGYKRGDIRRIKKMKVCY